MNRLQQTRPSGSGEHGRVLLGDLCEQLLHFDSLIEDIFADLGSHSVEDCGTDVEGAGVGRHGISVESWNMDVGNMLLNRKHREGVLACVQRFGVRLHVRSIHVLKSWIVTDREGSSGAKRCLNAICDEDRVVFLGEFARFFVEFFCHDLSGFAFAHHWLQIARLDVDVVLLRIGERLLQILDIIGFNGYRHVAFRVLKAGQMFPVRVAA
mmetsp:Transcript_2168/g.3974  ORF Transcript_2168/g.3974 Transcript_2168/m.3974 type:complete len:210 (-) Transcript_2168:833-1462(-)